MPVTLLDIAKLTNNDAIVGLVEENIKRTPELTLMAARTIRGTNYTTGIRTALPGAFFRDANDGVTLVKSTFDQKLIETKIVDSQMQVDAAVAGAYEDGPESLLAIEASGAMESVIRRIAQVIYGGTSVDAKGFPGLKSHTPFGVATSAGDALTINATGTTGCSSVYFVKYGVRDAQVVFGRGLAFEMPTWMQQQAYTSTGKAFRAFVSGITAWVGLQVAHENAVRRIANVSAEENKTLTDKLMNAALATFPVGYTPDLILMSRRSRAQLQASRTVVLQGNGRTRPDQESIAPLPTSFDGIPIVATDAISDTDAAESA